MNHETIRMVSMSTQENEIRRRYSMKCDAAAFAGMYETIYKDLYRYALCMMRNPHDAEDVVSETVIKGYERIHTLRSEDAFKSWMFTILSNVCKRKWKAMAKQSPVENENVWEQLSDEAAGEDTMNLRLDLRRALAVLSEEERMIIGLSVYGGYQSQEISKILHMKDGTVRSKRSRAIGKMSMVLKKGGAGYE